MRARSVTAAAVTALVVLGVQVHAQPKKGASDATRTSAVVLSAGRPALETKPLETKYRGTARWFYLPSAGQLRAASGSSTDAKGIRRLFTPRAHRVQLNPDGSLELSARHLPGSIPHAYPIPPHLGRGFLFTSDGSFGSALWRSNSWSGALVPLATENAGLDEVVFGFDRLYLLRQHTREARAIDLVHGNPLPNDPLPPAPSYAQLVVMDARFAAVMTDVQGLLVTRDAGVTWQSAGVYEPDVKLDAEADGIRVLRRGDAPTLLLTRDGTALGQSAPSAELAALLPLTSLASTPLPSTQPAKPELPALSIVPHLPTPGMAALSIPTSGAKLELDSSAPEPLGKVPLATAVLNGLQQKDHVLTLYQGNLAEVRLSDGKLTRLRSGLLPAGNSCHALQLGDAPSFACTEPSLGTRLYQWRADALVLVATFDDARSIYAAENGYALALGPCPGRYSGAQATHCILHPPDAPREVRVVGDAGLARVVPLSKHRVAILVPPRFEAAGSVTLLDGTERHSFSLILPAMDQPVSALLRRGLWTLSAREITPSVLGIWVADAETYVGVQLDLPKIGAQASRKWAQEISARVGTVKQGNLSRTSFSGARAVELTAAGIGWQTQDYGFRWQEFPLPRGLNPSQPADLRGTLVSPVADSSYGCTAVGCRFGSWLRVGYDSTTPTTPDAGEPEALPLTTLPGNVEYSNFHLNCFATGRQQAGQVSANALPDFSRVPPRHYSSFTTNQLITPGSEASIVNASGLGFLGVAAPRSPNLDSHFDIGADAESQFRAYAAGSRKDWNRSGRWLLRAADRFSLASVWSTGASPTPWVDFAASAQTFGADRNNRLVASWSYEPEPDEHSGILKIGTGGGSELHFVDENQPIRSLQAARSLGHVTSIVKVADAFYLGSLNDSKFRLHRLDGTSLTLLAEYPVSSHHTVSLVRDVAASKLAVLLRTRRGAIYLFPLGNDFAPAAPQIFEPSDLNRPVQVCASDTEGWLLKLGVPFNRVGGAEPINTLDFDGDAIGFRANSVVARAIANRSGVCLESVAAQRTNAGASLDGGPTQSAPVGLRQVLPFSSKATVPLTLTDRRNDVRYEFRCAP